MSLYMTAGNGSPIINTYTTDNTNYQEFKTQYESIFNPSYKVSIDWDAFYKNNINKTKEIENKNMAKLYDVFVIDNEGVIEVNGKTVVATSEEGAKMEADVYTLIKGKGKKLDDYTVIVRTLGEVKIKDKESK